MLIFKNKQVPAIFSRSIFIALITLSLTGCQKEENIDDLKQHPEEIQRALTRCQNHVLSITSSSALMVAQAHCDKIQAIATQFSKWITEQQDDPQKFGLKILKAQMALDEAKNELKHLQKAVLSPATQKNNAAIQSSFIRAKARYKEQCLYVKALLAVVHLQSPI